MLPPAESKLGTTYILDFRYTLADEGDSDMTAILRRQLFELAGKVLGRPTAVQIDETSMRHSDHQTSIVRAAKPSRRVRRGHTTTRV